LKKENELSQMRLCFRIQLDGIYYVNWNHVYWKSFSYSLCFCVFSTNSWNMFVTHTFCLDQGLKNKVNQHLVALSEATIVFPCNVRQMHLASSYSPLSSIHLIYCFVQLELHLSKAHVIQAQSWCFRTQWLFCRRDIQSPSS